MSPVQIKSPNPDEIWDRWKQRNVKSQDLEKHYAVKGAVFKIDDVTAAEYVKSVEKAAIIYFERSYEVKKGSPTKGKQEKADVKGVEKERFYEFKASPIKAEWRGDKEVAMANSLQPQSCPKCGGKGGVNCKKCNGTKMVACNECGGKAGSGIQCKYCNGSGKLEIEISVYNERNDRTKKSQFVKCDHCFGTGKLGCSTCGGSGKIPCRNCSGFGLESCGECRGFGTFFTYSILPVPFKEEFSSEPIILSSVKLSGIEKEIGQEIQKTLDQVEGIIIRTPEKELNRKAVEPNLGYMDKYIEKIIKEAEDHWKESQKKPEVKISLPIYVFPLQVLHCVTKKDRKFDVYSIGSQLKFSVFGWI